MQTIKKYANRKLYHTNRKQYITLDGIADLIKAGDHVRVVDNESGEDITASILAQVVLQAHGDDGGLPSNVLAGLIQAGGKSFVGLRRSLWAAMGGSAFVDVEIGQRLDRLLEAGAITAEEVVRLRPLLIPPGQEPTDLPSQSDVVRLHAQVDALAAAIEQLLTPPKK